MEGNIFGQLGARRTLAPPGPGTQAAARPQRQKLLLESKWQISPAWPPGLERRLPPARPAHKEAVSISLEARLPGITGWQLLTERGPSIEEVGHHLSFALDLDHTPALQLVCVGSQHLVHVRGDLRKQRRREDRPSMT